MSKKRDARILKKMKFGALESPIDERDYTPAMAMAVKAKEEELPKTYRTEGEAKILNQSSIGSCVAHAIATAMTYGEYKLGWKNVHDFSRGFIYGNRATLDYQGEGMYPRQAIKSVNKEGDCLYNDFPYNMTYPQVKLLIEKDSENLHKLAAEHLIKSYFRCYSEEEIKRAIMNQGAVIVGINVYSSFTGDCPVPSDDDTLWGGHCMAMVGWDETGWLIQNSWGSWWGNKGYLHLPYEYLLKEVWGIVINDEAKEPEKNNFFVRVCNAIKNFFKKAWAWIKGLFTKKK